MVSTDPIVWITSLIILAVLSYQIKDNVIYQITNYVFVGAGLGYTLILSLKTIRTTALTPMLKGDVSWIIPLAVSILMLFRFIPKYAYISRIPYQLVVGSALGLMMPTVIDSQLINQVTMTILPLNNFNNIFMFISVITVCFYFIFSTQRRTIPGEKYINNIGRYVLYIAFGASIGSTMLSRFTVYINLLMNLLNNWLGL